ncbi:MAG: adenylate/guanylate cyclase domain-containing protein [Leptospiraceae bacterium]|nr:adenylate/guanylate cyclase domain-containing protein [Leptospiraceae bacterium]
MAENENKIKPNIIDYIGVVLGVVALLLLLISLFLQNNSQFNILAIVLVLIIISAYPVYKFLTKTFENKQFVGGVWISIALSIIMYCSNDLLILVTTSEESSISWRFRMLKGKAGKSTIQINEGYIEQFTPPKEARKDIKIIGIKTETFDKVKGDWPLNWKYYSNIVKAFKKTSNILFFDIFFLDPKPGQFELMVDAMEGTSNVLLDYPVETTTASKNSLYDLDERHEVLRKFKLTNVIDKDDQGIAWLELAIPPLPSIADRASGLGFANIKKEDNASNRRMPLVVKLINHGPNRETEYYPSIDLMTVAKYYGVDVVRDTEIVMGEYVKIKNIPKKTNLDIFTGEENDIMKKPNEKREVTIPIDLYGQMEINFAGSLFCFQDEELYEVSEWDEETAENFQNNILLIAMYYATGSGAAKDTHLSPYGEMSGIEHHAHAINTILNQDFIRNSHRIINFLIIIGLGLGMGAFQSKFKTKFSFLLFAALIFCYTAVNMYFFDKFNLIIPLPSVIMNLFFIFITITGYKIFAEEENVKYIRQTFSKFVSKDVVDELLKDPDKIALGGARREITVFFSDVRGFTTLSESLSPEDLVQLLNEYLSAMTDSIIEMKGTIDKYMGDAIMAFWGAPIPLEDHAYYACVTALIQLNKLKELQISWKSRNLPSIDIGIGLNSGPAVVGNMGSSHRMDYTCMGDTVNLGSRLEGSNKMYATRIIISEYTYEKVKDRIYSRELDLVRVKGKNLPVRIYELIGLKDDSDFEKLKKPLAAEI